MISLLKKGYIALSYFIRIIFCIFNIGKWEICFGLEMILKTIHKIKKNYEQRNDNSG